MLYDTLDYDLSDGVALITLTRADRMNALNTAMRAELTHAVGRAAREARVVVLTGAGRAFCAGQDLGDARSVSDMDLERVLRDEYIPLLHAITTCPVPVMAAVNGAAAGAGASLALSCDVVIAAQSASFSQAFARIGLIPDAGGSWFLTRKIGTAKAMGAALFAEPISAAQAEAWGMIWEHVPDEEFDAHWRARAAQLANGPTAALSRVKQVIQAAHDNDLEAQLALEGRLQGECGKTRDFKEGVLAFHEKRPPAFEGR